MKPHAPALAALLTLISVPGLADECPVIAGGDPALAQTDPALRLHFIESSLADDVRMSRRYFWGWLGGYTAIAAAQLAVSPLFQPSDRVNMYVGASATVAGFGSLLIFPPAAMKEEPRMRKRLADMANADPCARLAEAEKSFLKVAKAETDSHHWLMHLLNIAYNTGVGLILVLGFDHAQMGAVTAVAGSAIGEVFINSAPKGAERALKRYRNGDLSRSDGDNAAFGWYVLPAVGNGEIGVRAGAVF